MQCQGSDLADSLQDKTSFRVARNCALVFVYEFNKIKPPACQALKAIRFWQVGGFAFYYIIAQFYDAVAFLILRAIVMQQIDNIPANTNTYWGPN